VLVINEEEENVNVPMFLNQDKTGLFNKKKKSKLI